MQVRIKRLHPDAIVPTRSESGSNGYDLYALEDVVIGIGKTAIIRTGISIEMVDDYHKTLPVFKIEDRSSLAIKGLKTGAGVIDYSYRGEIKVVMHNISASNPQPGFDYNYRYKINKGDKIAQGLIYLTYIDPIEEVDTLTETERGESGFGSSGK